MSEVPRHVRSRCTPVLPGPHRQVPRPGRSHRTRSCTTPPLLHLRPHRRSPRHQPPISLGTLLGRGI